MVQKRKKKSLAVNVRLDDEAIAALEKIQIALGPGIHGLTSAAVRRALINEAARL